jgi:hypothetical protein
MKTNEEIKQEWYNKNVQGCENLWTKEEIEEGANKHLAFILSKVNEVKVITVQTAKIEKESEKAILISSTISDKKAIWVPKSVANVLENGFIEIAFWFASKEKIQPIW